MSALPRKLGLFAGCTSLALACLPGTGPALVPESEDAGSVDLGGGDAGPVRVDADLGDPFAIDGLTPSHGPFTGGTRARIDGRGFTTKLRAFVGDREIDSSALLASDPTRAAIVTPPGNPGFVDVRIRDESTAKERVLVGGFLYDPIALVPDTGATSGGTRIRIDGAGTNWVAGATVQIGGVECTDVAVASPTAIDCVTPPGTPGAKDVVVTNGEDRVQARDAFTYSDSTDGYRGGLSGGALSGRLKVLAFSGATGRPLPGAFAVIGEDLATARVGRTTATGVVEISDLPGETATVSIAARCHQPVTFVDVPVDTVTVYLNPVMDPACIEGDPQPLPGGQSRFGGTITGQLVFPGASEFERAGWTTVPTPTSPTERRAAYVFEAAGSPAATFGLPSAAAAITPDSSGASGYDYSILVYPGNATIYVVAGLEDRSVVPPRFVPYAMGVARGVSVPAQSRVEGVDVRMDILFDHQVTLGVDPPTPGPRGPDRLTASVAVTLGSAGFAILPRGTRTTTIPAPEEIPFVGVPMLGNGLAGEQYVVGGIAATGADGKMPASYVSRVKTTNANTTVFLGGFLDIPVLAEPGQGVWDGTHIRFTAPSGPSELNVLTITSGAGLVTWTIAVPAGRTTFTVPDLAALPGPDPVGLRQGAITTTLYSARIEGFEYARLRSGNLGSGTWTAYSVDSLTGVY